MMTLEQKNEKAFNYRHASEIAHLSPEDHSLHRIFDTN